MLPLRRAQYWRFADAVLLLLVFAMALLPTDWFSLAGPLTVDWIEHGDKWLHGAVFVFLAVWFAGQYESSAYWRIGMSLIAFGLLIEAGQWLVGYRSAEWLDVAADMIGTALGLAMAAAGLGGWAQALEAWRAGRASGANND